MLASAGSDTEGILNSISRAFCKVLCPSTPPARERLFRPADRPRRTGRSTDPPRPDPKLQMASHSATMNDRASDVEESDDDASVDDEDLKNTDCLYQLSHFWWCRPDENEDASAQAATWESMRDRHCGVCSCILVSESVVFELKPCGHHLCAQCYVLDFQGGFDHQKRLSPDKTPQYTCPCCPSGAQSPVTVDMRSKQQFERETEAASSRETRSQTGASKRPRTAEPLSPTTM